MEDILTFHRLKELRDYYGYTQKEIAAAIGIPQSSYCEYERGKHQPPYHILENLAQYYRTNVQYLMGDSDDNTYHQKSKRKEKLIKFYKKNTLF